MSFQVSFSIYQKVQGTIDSFDAGIDQLVLCSLSVYLNANVIGDLTGHTTEWEQLTGNIVPLITDSNIQSHFIKTESSDKIFRFWIDRYTIFAQYDDVTIWGTPTETTPASLFGSTFRTGLTNVDPVPCSSIAATINISAPPPISLQGDGPPASVVFIITWSLPSNPLYSAYLTSMELYENNILVGTYSPVATRTYTGIPAIYKVLSKFNVNGILTNSVSCNADFTGLTYNITRLFDDTIGGASFGTSNFIRTIYANIYQNVTDITNFGVGTSTITSLIRYTNLAVQEPVDVATGSVYGSKINSFIRYSSGSIGGG